MAPSPPKIEERLIPLPRRIPLQCDLPGWDMRQQKAPIASGSIKPPGPPVDYLSKLPAEILLKILDECTVNRYSTSTRNFFQGCDLIFSLCAGLACKRMYNLHFSLFGTIDLKWHAYGTESYIVEGLEIGDGSCWLHDECSGLCTVDCLETEEKLFGSYELLHDWFTAGGYEERLGFVGCKYRKIRDTSVPKQKRKKNRGHGRKVTTQS